MQKTRITDDHLMSAGRIISVPHDEELLLNYFCHQLELFSNICFGHHQHAIDQLTKGLNVNLLLSIVSNEKFPYQLRAASCKLITHLFIDCGKIKGIMDMNSWSEPGNVVQSERNEETIKLVEYVENYLKEVSKHGFITKNSVSF